MNIIEAIISLEWQAFDAVQNEGGRANCQDDHETFEIMRKSQFLCWDEATQLAYLDDLQRAKRAGRNLVQEKYARMMASTAPARYAEFAHLLPVLEAAQIARIEAVVAVEVAWREAFAREFPHMSDKARLIRTTQDTPYSTSFETYLRGELYTYSPNTLALYCKLIDRYRSEDRNLSTETMEHTARLYGYASLAAAERKLEAGSQAV
jgi:Protein of unknown function (DUF4125)